MGSNTNGNTDATSWLYRPAFPTHWNRQPLYSLARWINGLAFRDIQFGYTGKPVIKIAEIKNGISDQTKYTEQVFDESVHVTRGDLLFSWSGQPETSIDAYWWRGPDGWLNQHTFRVIPVGSADPSFFFYLLRYLKPNFIGIARNKQTTGLGHVTKRDLEHIEVACPPLSEQRAIADILGSLDDKIELNRRMNATLEAMARALFKSWFVDFDPVRAKMDGRAPAGMDAETAALFPARLVDSELGPIPEGWRVERLENIAEFHNARRVPLSNRERATRQGRYPYYGAASVIDHVDDYLFNGVHLLVGEDGSVITEQELPVLQYVWGKFWVNNHAHVLTGRNDVCVEHLLLALQKQNIRAYVTGAVQPKLNQGNLKSIPVLYATPTICREFANRVQTIFARYRACEEESRNLASIRDTLLPKLLSGEVAVGQAYEV